MSNDDRAQYGSFVNIPDKSDAEKVAGVIKEIDNALMMIAAKRDYIKEAKKALKDDFELTPKSIQTMIQRYHKQDAEGHFQEQEELHDLYYTLFPVKNAPTDKGDNDE